MCHIYPFSPYLALPLILPFYIVIREILNKEVRYLTLQIPCVKIIFVKVFRIL